MSERPDLKISVGRDLTGQVVIGDDAALSIGTDASGRPTQSNTAQDDSTIYAVKDGDLHIHHHERSDRRESDAD